MKSVGNSTAFIWFWETSEGWVNNLQFMYYETIDSFAISLYNGCLGICFLII